MSLAKQTMENQLQKLSISIPVDIAVTIHHNQEQYVKQVNPDTRFIWEDHEYAWFTVNRTEGGTDAHCRKISARLTDWETYIEDSLNPIAITPPLKQQIIDCGYEWHFRRSAGQPPLINIAYGHLAAAVAGLTNGYIYTHDGAWNDQIFPATAEQLLEVYFYPDKSKHAADYDWVTRCIAGL